VEAFEKTKKTSEDNQMDLAVALARRVGEGVFFYYFIQLAFYFYHRLLHQPFMGPLYRAHHIQHHKVTFPLKRLRSVAYGLSPSDETIIYEKLG
jgi:hypothetical protein